MAIRFIVPLSLLTLVLVATAPPLRAQQSSEPQALVMSATNLTADAEAAQGQARESEVIQGGDAVRYSLLFTNVTDRPVRQVVLSNAVPAGFGMIAGSAQASRTDAAAEYSADGGTTWAAQPMEDVLVDGRIERRPIPAERFTHVRWTLQDWLAPDATVTADFDVRLKSAPTAAPRAGQTP
jgi:uncharacterized repeat protein (TIGR01451 family)